MSEQKNCLDGISWCTFGGNGNISKKVMSPNTAGIHTLSYFRSVVLAGLLSEEDWAYL